MSEPKRSAELTKNVPSPTGRGPGWGSLNYQPDVLRG